MYTISGFLETSSKSARKPSVGKKTHEGHYPTKGNLAYMDPGEVDQMIYEAMLGRHYDHQFRTVADVLDGEQIGCSGVARDFRDDLDRQEPEYSWCEIICGGVIIVHDCTPKFLERLHEAGCSMLKLEPGIYFLESEHINFLALAS